MTNVGPNVAESESLFIVQGLATRFLGKSVKSFLQKELDLPEDSATTFLGICLISYCRYPFIYPIIEIPAHPYALLHYLS